MKNASNTIIIAALTILSFTSCVKQMDALPVNAPASSTVEKFSDMKADENFKWTTYNKIKFNFLGSVGSEYELVLKVQDSDGNTVFQKLQKGNENFDDVFEIPSHCETLLVTFGSISKEFNCNSGSISFAAN